MPSVVWPNNVLLFGFIKTNYTSNINKHCFGYSFGVIGDFHRQSSFIW